MNWTNFHTHSYFCDGKGQLEDYVIKAIDKKMSSLGFSSHAPIPFDTDWHMKKESLDQYLKEIGELKNKYKDKINIYSGLEVDFILGIIGPNSFSKQQLDIIIGSIHYVGQFENGLNCCIDNTNEEFERGLKTIFGNDIKKLVGAYYQSMVSMIENDPPDIIGHLDLIKKLNGNNRYFNAEESWYRNIIANVLEVIASKNCIVEINTKGHYKGITKDFYPSDWILKECYKLKIPVTISSDAHKPIDVDNSFEKAASLLLDIGYEHVNIFDNGKWCEVGLEKNGLKF